MDSGNSLIGEYSWSEVFQPPEYLEATRISLLNPEFAPIVLKYCGIKPNMKVLEVGCGTGAFSRYLASVTNNVEFTCVDYDAGFIENAAKQPFNGSNTFKFIKANAFNLPFEDDCFDAVISHTFLKCIKNPQKAMDQMKRVVKHDGVISSVTPMSFLYEAYYLGDYPDTADWYKKLSELNFKIHDIYEKIFKILMFDEGIKASKMPRFFADSGLKQIKILPLGKAFSLSNFVMPLEEKKKYIENLYIGERKKVLAVKNKFPEYFEDFSTEELEEYLLCLKQRRDFWLNNIEDNTIWDWFGGASLLVSAKK